MASEVDGTEEKLRTLEDIDDDINEELDALIVKEIVMHQVRPPPSAATMGLFLTDSCTTVRLQF